MNNRLLEAAWFAAQRHANQRRKNEAATPYINHPLEVAAHLSRVGNIIDEEVLIAALLHDTIEDTDTTAEELEQLFGARVTRIVLECTDDKTLPKAERKRLQIVNAPHKSDEAKQVKIADKTCNLESILADPPFGWDVDRQREYFSWAEAVVAGLLGTNPALDQAVTEVLARGRELLAAR